MKWGVRRFQKKDGTLTPAGKKRYSDESGKIKVTHRSILEKKYRDSGMSAEEAKAAADKRIKVEKVVAVTAGLTVAACAAYYAKNKWTETYCDQVLKAGTTFHNLDSAANPRLGEHLYVNYRQNDVNYFRGHFAVNKMRKTGEVFNHTLTAEKDVKIPSLNTRKNVFKELYEKDDQFREAFEKHTWRFNNPGAAKTPNLTYKRMWQKFGDKDTPEFNIAKRKYFDALSKKGYDAIVDEWDTSKGVFRSDAPLILLNTSSKSLGEMSIKELSGREILLSQANSKHYRTSRDLLTAIGAPHTNHFKESTSHLSRYARKSMRNEQHLDTALNALASKTKGSVDDIAKINAIKRKGAVLADAGKYISRHENMSIDRAYAIANTKHNTIQSGKTFLDYGITLGVPYATLIAAGRNKYVRDYIKEHPNTKLTYEQIKQQYGVG